MIKRIFSVVLLTIFLTSCGGGGGGSSTPTTPPPTPPTTSAPPTAAKIHFAVVTGTETATLEWLSGDDDVTSSSNLIYRIHADTSASFVVSDSNMVSEITGDLSTELTGLKPDTNYFLKLVTIDGDDQSTEDNIFSLKTLSQPALAHNNVNHVDSENLGLSYESENGAEVTFSHQGNIPVKGEILTYLDNYNETHLVKVLSVNQQGSQITVRTEQASLSEVLESATISNTLLLSNETAELPFDQSSNKPFKGARTTRANKTFSYVFVHPETGKPTEVSYDGDKLTLSQQGGSDKIVIDPEIKFEPKLKQEYEWDLGGLEKAYAKASGTLHLGTKVTASTTTELFNVDHTVPIPAFTRHYRKLFLVGNIPVYQDVKFSLDVKVKSTISSAIELSREMSTDVNIAITAEYIEGDDWKASVSGPSFDYTDKSSANATIDGVAEIRFIPKIEVRYYTVAAPYFTLEPYAKAELKAEASINKDYLTGLTEIAPIAFKNFDVLLDTDCTAGFNINILYLASYDWQSKNLCTFVEPTYIFALPEIEIQEQASSSPLLKKYKANVTNKGLNEFDQASAVWELIPEDPDVSILMTDAYNVEVDITNGSHEKYTLLFSGHGLLGEIARQHKKVEFEKSNSTIAVKQDGKLLTNEGDGSTWNTININNQYELSITNTSETSITIDSINFEGNRGFPDREPAILDFSQSFPITLEPEQSLIGIMSLYPDENALDVFAMLEVNTTQQPNLFRYFWVMRIEHFVGDWAVAIEDTSVNGEVCEAKYNSHYVRIDRTFTHENDSSAHLYRFNLGYGAIVIDNIPTSDQTHSRLNFSRNLTYPEDGGTTTENWTIIINQREINGESTWSWSDGTNSCSGTSQMIGTRF